MIQELKDILDRKGMTAEQLSRATGISTKRLNADRGNLRVSETFRIQQALDLTGQEMTAIFFSVHRVPVQR